MSNRRRILVPTDFSPGAVHGRKVAVDLARALDASIVLLNVYELPSFTLPDGSVVLAEPQTHADLISTLTQQLVREAELVAEAGVPVATRTEQGPPVATILRVLQEPDWYLVVMGTHGRGGLGRLVLGSVAEGVVRGSDTPVLTVRHPSPPIKLPAVPII